MTIVSMSGANSKKNMPMFSSGPQYSIRNFTDPPTNRTGMRAHFMKQAAAATSLDPAVIRAAAMNKATGGPMTKGGKRRATRRKARTSRRKTARK